MTVPAEGRARRAPGGTPRNVAAGARPASGRRPVPRPGWDAPVRERPTPAAFGESYFLLRVKSLVTVERFLIFTVATVGWKPSLATMT